MSKSSSEAVGTFVEVHILKCPRDLEELATEKLFALGAEGVSENLMFRQADLRYDPEIDLGADCDLTAYFQPNQWRSEACQIEWASVLNWLRELSPNSETRVIEREDQDWLEEWKKGFEPFCFAGPFWVVPAWLEAPAHLSPWQILRVEPGMAFGTGTHETTQICAQLLIEYAGALGPLDRAPLKGQRVLDVGCGTGILGLVALRLGADFGVGLDIDPEARRTARENLQLNQMSQGVGADSSRLVIDDRDLSEIASEIQRDGSGEKGKYDIVLANIIDGVLLQLASDLARCTRRDGILILSGVLNERRSVFLNEFPKLIADNFTEDSTRRKQAQMGEWCGFAMRARST